MAITTSMPFGAARVVVVASAVVAPIVHAAAMATSAVPWLTAVGLTAGMVGGLLAPAGTVAALLAVAPLWQVLATGLTGDTDIHLVMPWLAALAACLAAAQPARWRTAGVWAVAVCAWALVLAVTWPVTVAREFDFARQAIAGLSANGSGSGPARFVAASVALAAECQIVALLLFDWLSAARDDDHVRTWRWCGPAVAVACLLAIAQSTVAPGALSREPWIALGRSAGAFYDANALGALAALFGMLAGSGLMSSAPAHPVLRAIGWLTLTLAAVLASGSRTAVAAWLVMLPLGLQAPLRQRRRVVIGLTAAIVAGLGVAAVIRGPVPGDRFAALARLFDTVRLAGSDASTAVQFLWNRDGYGAAATAMIAEHPLVGVGPGSFGVVVADYGRLTGGVALPPDNAQNWWRHQWAELGLLGALPAIVCSLLAGAAAWRAWRSSTRVWALPILALGAMSLVSPPVQHPIVQVLIALLLATTVRAADGPVVAAAAVDETGRHDVAADPARAVLGGAVWLVALGCAVGLGVEGARSFRPSIRAARFGFVYHYGFSGEFATAQGPARWAARHAVGVFAPSGRPLALTVSAPHADLARAPVTVAIADRGGVVCTWLITDGSTRDCILPVRAGEWPLVRVSASRAWDYDGSQERAVLVRAAVVP